MARLGPRLVVAGTSSGVGKTTVATGLMAAFRQRGMVVGAAKVGPDFIDPGYHGLATGRPGRNLDSWICGVDAIAPLAGRAAAETDVLVVEGVMGLFDGSGDPAGPAASTAEVAGLLGAPVVLVVDGSSVGASVAAMVHGFATFDPATAVAGVILNRVGSDGHEALLRQAIAPIGVPVLGALRRSPDYAWRDRHLGLVPVVEQPDQVRRSLDALAAAVARDCDLDAILALARSSPATVVAEPPTARRQAGPLVAVAGGPAFSFTYPDNLELLAQAGAELVPFDPLTDRRLPDGARALYAGGGFPEVFAAALAANRPLLDDVRRRVDSGLVTWAECGGLLWLARSLDGHALAGVVPADGRMTDRLTLGYRRTRLRVRSPLGPAGTDLRGHEFRYSTLDPAGDAFDWSGRAGSGRAGFATPTLLASYVHVHIGAAPDLAERFVATADAGL
ncbi:MAG TPA: cobyrinate a,c-diamide synthase [Acidimicrobiales bacterium]|nr:cobyrinate a,c-diamide synthase [Acidimicrobiales bacterium]